MTVATATPAVEEAAARAVLRRLERARRARAAQVARSRRQALRTALRATRKRYPGCRCDLNASMGRAELIELGSGCTDHYVCPRLDAIRRAAGI